MATQSDDEFSIWLSEKLKELNTDEGVFGSYITGILDGDETMEEKNEALDGILSEIITTDTSQIKSEIMNMWMKLRQPDAATSAQVNSVEDVDVKLAKLLESRSLQAPKQKKYTEEEKKIREAILSQYSQMTDDEDEEDAKNATGDTKEDGLEKNTNAQNVMQAEKERREHARLESQKKKEKDREDRDKQKQLKEEKKEKRKTQKGERRR